jgi:hypothetical protein
MKSRLVDKRLWNNRLFPLESPEGRLKPKLVHALDEDADVMAEHLAQDLVDLGGWVLGPNRTPELCLYHGEGGLHVRPLVIMLQEGLTVEVVVVPHPVPQAVVAGRWASHPPGVALEGNVGRSARSLDCVKVAPAGIGLVRRHLVDGECLGGLVQQGDKLDGVGRLTGCRLDAGDDVGLDPAHDVGFHKRLLAAVAVLVVEPSGICLGGEAGGVNGEVGLYRPQRAGALLYEAFQQGSQLWVLKVAEGAVVVCGFGDQPRFLSLFQLGGEPPSRHGGVGLEHETEHHVGQRQPRSPEPVFRLLDAVAEVSEQGDKLLLLVGLRLVVGRPVLGVGHLHRFGHDLGAVGASLPLDDELDGVYVLALLAGGLEVSAGAERLAVVHVHDVSPVAGLGWDLPAQPVFPDRVRVRYRQSSLSPNFHLNTPYYDFLFCAYFTIHCIGLSIVFRPILPNFSKFPIDNTIQSMVGYSFMNDVQTRIAQLQEKGWTLAALADELEVTPNAIEKWKAGDRSPSNLKATLAFLDKLLERKRIPKKRRYNK